MSPEETVAEFKAWLDRDGNGDAQCTCEHTLRCHFADLNECADCEAYEPVHARCGGFLLRRGGDQ